MPTESARITANRGGSTRGRHILEVGIPSQAEPEQAVARAEALIRTSEDAQLMAQGENLEEEV